MTKYLYGASVQGIQSFIFQTNKLQEIVGASELVEQICTRFFKGICPNYRNENSILSAAGNIKYQFENKADCEQLVLLFPKEVLKIAPGITISQAVVEFDQAQILPIDELERRLRIQRNKPLLPTEIGFMGLERARRTGSAGFTIHETRKKSKEVICEATTLKRAAINSLEEPKSKEILFKKLSGLENIGKDDVPYDIEGITASGKNSWIAVIHADGNGLGNIIQEIGNDLSTEGRFRLFSEAIETSTLAAARDAFRISVKEKEDQYKYPVRPVVLGGDDLTLVIRADLALEFTEIFLKKFEEYSEREFTNLKLQGYTGGLTACAGIAYVKESYPLHYALNVAEMLCADAKKKVKDSNTGPKYGDIPKSALAFYKVQDSFIEDFKELKKRTMITSEGLDFYFGPYLLNDLAHLKGKVEVLNKEAESREKTKAVSKLRQLVTECYRDCSTALLMLNRIKEVNSSFYNDLRLDAERARIESKSPSQLVDLITLHSFKYGNRKN